MKSKVLLVVIALFLISAPSYADDVPKIVIDGLNAYKTAGFTEAFAIWLKDSPLESDKTTTMNLKGSFTQIESMYGKMTSYEILRTLKISSASYRVYAELRYDKGPLFMLFDCYKSAHGWIIPIMRFHSEADKILPVEFLKMK